MILLLVICVQNRANCYNNQDSNDLSAQLKRKCDYFVFKIKPNYDHVTQIQDTKLAKKCLKNHEYSIQLDESNKSTKQQDVIVAEFDHKMECKTCKDLGHKSKSKSPPEFKKIRVHLVCDVKHDDRRKWSLEVATHLTSTPLCCVFSRVVPLKVIRLFIFLVELNGIESWGTGIGNS